MPLLEPVPIPFGVPLPPAVDNELVLTVRLRLAGPDVRDRVGADEALARTVGALHAAVVGLLDPGDVDLAGIEIVMPSFEPYHTTR